MFVKGHANGCRSHAHLPEFAWDGSNPGARSATPVRDVPFAVENWFHVLFQPVFVLDAKQTKEDSSDRLKTRGEGFWKIYAIADSLTTGTPIE